MGETAGCVRRAVLFLSTLTTRPTPNPPILTAVLTAVLTSALTAPTPTWPYLERSRPTSKGLFAFNSRGWARRARWAK